MTKYFVEAPQTVYGIEGSTRVFGKLVDVPICLGSEPVAAPRVVPVMFRYVDQPGYHVIFGRTFLENIHTILNMGPDQELMYSITDDTKYTIPVVTGDVVRRSRMYQEARTRIQKNLVPPHSCQSDVAKAFLVGQTGSLQSERDDQVGLDDGNYLCPSLQQIEARVEMLQEFGDDFMDDTWVSESSVEQDNWCELPNPSTDFVDMVVHQITAIWARSAQGTQSVSILMSTMAADTETQYKKRPPKGKPLPKDPMVRHLKVTSVCRVAIVGPDFVGVTSGLSYFQLHEYHVELVDPLLVSSREYDGSYCTQLVSRWEEVCTIDTTVVTDILPQEYLQKYQLHLPMDVRAAALAELGRLAMPDFHVLFMATGSKVARRAAALVLTITEDTLAAQAQTQYAQGHLSY